MFHEDHSQVVAVRQNKTFETDENGKHIYTFHIKMQKTFPSGTYIVRVGNNIAVEEGQFAPKLSANAEYVGQNFSVFYYNESNMASDFNAKNITDYLPQMLKSNSVFMGEPSIDGNIYIWNNTVGGSSDGSYLVGVPSEDATEMVCVEGNNLDDLKTFANSVEF
jgi:hypothetical protein